MSHWDFGHPPSGRHDAPGPAEPQENARPTDDPWLAGYDWAPEDSGPAGDGWAGDDRAPADGGWPVGDPWPADNGWTRDEAWPASEPWPAGEPWPADGGQTGIGLAGLGLADTNEGEGDGEGESTGPYPITYERDASIASGAWPDGRTPDDDHEPRPRAPFPGERGEPGHTAVLTHDDASEGHGERADDYADGRQGDAAWRDGAWPGRRGPGVAGRAWPGQVPGEPGEDWGYQGDGSRRRSARRWLIPAGVVAAGAAVGAAAVLLTSGHADGRAGQGAGTATPAATPRGTAGGTGRGTAGGTAGGTASAAATPAGPPLSVAEAQQVLAGYTTVNNEANAQRSAALLATIEAGSSYAIDAGLYQMQQAAGSAPFPPFTPVQATYYIPRGQTGAGPRWFVVQVANAFTSNTAKVTSTEYLLFTQSAPGAPWQDTIEPYLLPAASAPQVAVGSDGLATAVSPDDATVTVAPGQLPAVTAASLDGTGGGQAAVADPGNLADRADQHRWQAAVQGGQVSDAHSPAAGADGQEFALLTADGGALVFYTDAAEVTVTPPAGAQLQLTIPGFYSAGQALAQARVSYLEQFAAYDPPAAAGGAPSVVADYSGITGAS